MMQRMIEDTGSNYEGQLTDTNEIPEFSERLRNEAVKALDSTDVLEIIGIKETLSRLAIVQANADLDPHQALIYLTKVQTAHPRVPNPAYDELISSAWNIEDRKPELFGRFMIATGNSQDNETFEEIT